MFTEPTLRKASDIDLKRIEFVEHKIYESLHMTLNLIHTRFQPFRNKFSPKVSAIQSNMNIHDTCNVEERNIKRHGYLSCN